MSIAARIISVIDELIQLYPTGDFSTVEDTLGAGALRLSQRELDEAFLEAPPTSPWITLTQPSAQLPPLPLPQSPNASRTQRLREIEKRTRQDFPPSDARRGAQPPNGTEECQLGVTRRLVACLFEATGIVGFRIDYEAALTGFETFQAVVVRSSELEQYLAEQGLPFFVFQEIEDQTKALVFRLQGPSGNDYLIVFAPQRLKADLVQQRIPFGLEYLSPRSSDFREFKSRFEARRKAGMAPSQVKALANATPRSGFIADSIPLESLDHQLRAILQRTLPPQSNLATVTRIDHQRLSSQDLKRLGITSFAPLLRSGPPLALGQTALFASTARVVDRAGHWDGQDEVAFITFVISKHETDPDEEFVHRRVQQLFRPGPVIKLENVGILEPQRVLFMTDVFRGERRVHKDDSMATGMVADSDLTEHTAAAGTAIIKLSRDASGAVRTIRLRTVYVAHSSSATPLSKSLSLLALNGLFQRRTSFELRPDMFHTVDSLSSPPRFAITSTVTSASTSNSYSGVDLLAYLLEDVKSVLLEKENTTIFHSEKKLERAIKWILNTPLSIFFGEDEIRRVITTWKNEVAPLSLVESEYAQWRALERVEENGAARDQRALAYQAPRTDKATPSRGVNWAAMKQRRK